MCAGWHPDLAILDVQMPRLDGCAAARIMRDGSRPPLLIASLTAMSFDDEPLRSGGPIFDFRLSKPARIAEVDELIARTHCSRS
jgi:CheY-like chemotaxis protein